MLINGDVEAGRGMSAQETHCTKQEFPDRHRGQEDLWDYMRNVCFSPAGEACNAGGLPRGGGMHNKYIQSILGDISSHSAGLFSKTSSGHTFCYPQPVRVY